MNQRAERRRKNERRILPTVGDRRSSEPEKVLIWSEPEPLDWSDADEAAPDETGRFPESGTE